MQILQRLGWTVLPQVMVMLLLRRTKSCNGVLEWREKPVYESAHAAAPLHVPDAHDP